MLSLIILMGCISFSLRALPFIYKNNQLKANLFFIKSMDYAVCFIIGNIIFNVAFGKSNLTDFIKNFDVLSLISIFVLVIAFWLSKKTKSIFKSLIVTLFLFIIAVLMFK